MSGYPSFDEFYAAVNGGRRPFPWQSRLAEQVVAGGWPAEIGVPTGLGKTSCLDVAVWALGSQAGRPAAERTLATRTWYVVNRRLLVDAAYEHGRRLARLLALPELLTAPDAPDHRAPATAEDVEVVRAVAEALGRIRGWRNHAGDPLMVTRLRGGAELGARPPHPAQPALVFATVPMFSSTWLFRGYASSFGMRPVDAAHAGIDTLVLLDEAHLSRPLRDLVGPVSQCDAGDPAVVVNAARARPVMVSLTATGDAVDPFTLDDADHAHPVVRRRLDAAKPVRLVGKGKKADALAGDLISELRREMEDRPPSAAVVFRNSPADARAVFDLLTAERAKRRSWLAEADLVLLTGRMRRFESDAARAAVLDPVAGAQAGRDPAVPRPRHLVVVATQTLEVGADLDFDVLVTESCGARALVQRLGRLNRLGDRPEARAVLVHPDKQQSWYLYGEEPDAVWQHLQAADHDGDAVVSLSPATVAGVVGEPDDRPSRVAELLPAHLWEWAKTTMPPPGEAPIEPFVEGFEEGGPRVSVCWRATRFAVSDRLVPSVAVDEAVDVPISEARRVLTERFSADGAVVRLARDRVAVEESTVADLRPGDVVVLHTSHGLYDDHGWSPSGRGEVLDVSLARWPGLPLDIGTLGHWAAGDAGLDDMRGVVALLRGDDDVDLGEIPERALVATRGFVPRPEVEAAWVELVEQLAPRLEWSGQLALVARRRSRGKRRPDVLMAADAFDDLSANAASVSLSDHLDSVGKIAERLGQGIGLPDALVAAVTAAGRFHDLGKTDPRFQRWLDPRGTGSGPLAKSGTSRVAWRAQRAASGWPAGGRHEALSARLLAAWLDQQGADTGWDRELVTHLVLSHHGYGRPLVAPVEDPEATACAAELDGTAVTVSGDLSIVDWDQPGRFRRCCEHYGYWGLALLEAVVRQADHLASSAVAPVEVA